MEDIYGIVYYVILQRDAMLDLCTLLDIDPVPYVFISL
jgi:hypothetical protein